MKRLRILFIDRSTALNTVKDLETRARGGMVSSLFRVADYLARRGHAVMVWAGIKEIGVTEAGVCWAPTPVLECDVLVANRGIGDAYPGIDAKARILWTHDLPHDGFVTHGKVWNAVRRVVFMSGYAERVWRAMWPQIGRSVEIPNGVDRDVFKPGPKDYERIIYASAPNRGLKRLAFLLDCLRELHPGVRITAFSNMAVLHPRAEDSDMTADGWNEHYESAAGGGVELRDPVPQKALAVELGASGLMLMPTDYPEICSNIILQSLACGTPVVTTGGLGSAGEWIRSGRNGHLTEWRPQDYMVYQKDLVRAVHDILSDRKRHQRMCEAAAKTQLWSWDEVGAAWVKLVESV